MAEALNQDCPDCGSKRTRVLQTRKLKIDDLSVIDKSRRQLTCHNCGCVWDIRTEVSIKTRGAIPSTPPTTLPLPASKVG